MILLLSKIRMLQIDLSWWVIIFGEFCVRVYICVSNLYCCILIGNFSIKVLLVEKGFRNELQFLMKIARFLLKELKLAVWLNYEG